jgi:hypothetical protein
MGTRSLAGRLKRLETRFLPQDCQKLEIVIQKVDSTGRVVGTYTLTPQGLKERPETTVASAGNDNQLVVDVLQPPRQVLE